MPNLPFRIGSDPEFVIVANGLKLASSRVFRAHIPNWGGSLSVGKHGNFGTDHNEIAELRPSASYDPLKHAEHIRELLASCHKVIPVAELKTTSLWAPIGGHVHLEATDAFMNLPDRTKKTIHQAMMSFAIPLFVGENHINARIRIERGGYGKINDVRIESKGESYTWEFRPLTAEWLTTPETCAATLSYLGVIWNQFVRHPDEIKKYKDVIIRNDQQAFAFQSLAIDEFQSLLLPLVKQIKKHVQTFEHYGSFKEQCDLALSPKAMLELKEKVDWDIVRGWKLAAETSKIPSKRNLSSDKISKTRMASINLDLMKSYQQIFWSNDRNLERVARAIGDRAIAWNWNLTNRYFFFGLPKEAPSPVAVQGDGKWLLGYEMAKTRGDAGILQDLVDAAKNSFAGSSAFNMSSVSLKTGKAERDTKHSIMIGVPLKHREEGNFKPILSFIHDLETKKLSGKVESLKDLNLPETDPRFGVGQLVPTPEEISTPETPSADTLAGSGMDFGARQILEQERSNSITDTPLDTTLMYDAENAVLSAEEVSDIVENLVTN
jgi:hypothetical protein